MYINHNSMATGVANNLTGSYSNLATSTQRLSSGLRVNSAADDAAGLAIRELMRADIASLDQGVRNANDAISLIQTADGALGIIDEKLIRMKELAEQASTGTYDSTQRLMIESEYQAMASEITRIANATDFNGIKLLNGNLSGTHDGSKMDSTGELKVHFGAGNDSAEDYYYIGIEEMTSQALGVGNASTWQDVQARGTDAFKKELTDQIKNDKTLTDKERGELLNKVDEAAEQFNKALNNATDYKQAHKYWGAGEGEGFMPEGKEFPGNSTLMNEYMAVANAATQPGGPTTAAEITTKITNAINDSLPVASEVNWETDKEKFAVQQTEMWNKLEADVKTAAKEAGLNDAEIKELLYGVDGKADDIGGLKGEWLAVMTDAAKTPPADNAAGDQLITDVKAALLNTSVAGTAGDLATFMAADSQAHPGLAAASGTNGDVIAARNAGYANYANAAADAKPAVGPTKAEDIVRELQAAVDEAWKEVDVTADGNIVSNTAGSKAAEQTAKVYAAIEKAAVAAGMTSDEAKSITTALNATATTLAPNSLAGVATNGVIDNTATAADKADAWEALKANIKDAVAGVNGQAKTITAMNTATGMTGVPVAGETLAEGVAIRNQGAAAAQANDKLDEFWNGLRDTEKQKLQYAWGQAAMHNLANADEGRDVQRFGIDAGEFSFDAALGLRGDGTDINMKDNDMLSAAIGAAHDKTKDMDFAGYTIETQEDAQQALNALTDAITQKDKTRAHLGALQNRLENTVSNLTVQSENLQAAESRISDVDVAKEMTNFVRNQILTQSAVAMLSQANSMPQMAMQLIH